MFAQYLQALHQTQFAMCNVTAGDQTDGLGQDQPNNTLLNPMAYLICTLISLFVRPEADLRILMLYVRQSVSLPCLPLPDLCSAKFFFATISTSPDFYFVYFYKSDISLHIYHKTIPWLTHYWLPTSPDCLPATGHCTVWYLLWHAAIQTFWSVFNIQYFNISISSHPLVTLWDISTATWGWGNYPQLCCLLTTFLTSPSWWMSARRGGEERGSSARVKYKIIVTSSARDSCVTGGRGTPGYLWRFLWKFMVFLMGHFFLLWDYDTASLFAGLIPLSQVGSERVQCGGCTT